VHGFTQEAIFEVCASKVAISSLSELMNPIDLIYGRTRNFHAKRSRQGSKQGPRLSPSSSGASLV